MTNKTLETNKTIEEKQTAPQSPELTQELALKTPEQDTQFAHVAAKQLMEIVRANGWAKSFNGQSEHLQVEAWLTVGKYYGLSVDTDQLPVEYIELGGVWGFKAHAQVIDTKTGIRVGGASAFCMSDEGNWSKKPKFQLASMAQTRATSKALRQILSFVVALAGFSPTPAEEMSKDTEEWLNKPVVNETKEIEGEIVTTNNNSLDACEDCQKLITWKKVVEFSTKNYGRALCYDCQAKEKARQHG